MTSKGTQDKDQVFKKILYSQLGVQEYWMFDPKDEWVDEQLQGYRLRGEDYEPITDGCSEPLQLRPEIEGQLIGLYRLDTGERLLIPSELAQVAKQEALARKREADARAKAEARVAQLEEKLRSLGVDPDELP